MNNKWESFIKRQKQEARDVLRNNKTDGVAIITTHAVTTYDGDLLFFVVQNGNRVEPSKDARRAIRALIGGLD